MTNKKILYIDDEDDLRALVVAQLSLSGFDAEGTADGMEAVGKIANGAYDAVLLDLNMPGMNGVQVVEELRKRTLSPKIILLTGASSEAAEHKARELGAAGSIAKPFHFKDLLTLIQSVID
jgi:DNA-binding response OmpR family regulator